MNTDHRDSDAMRSPLANEPSQSSPKSPQEQLVPKSPDPSDSPRAHGTLQLKGQVTVTLPLENIRCPSDVGKLVDGAFPHDSHPADRYLNFGECLIGVYQVLESMEYLDEAVEAFSTAAQLCLQDDREPNTSPSHVSQTVSAQETGPKAFFPRAYYSIRMAETLDLRFEAEESKSHNDLATEAPDVAAESSARQKQRDTSLGHLDRAAGAFETALVGITKGSDLHVRSLYGLGSTFLKRFERTHSIDDIDRCVATVSKMVDATPPDSKNHALSLAQLAHRFSARYMIQESMDDLDCTIYVAEKAVNALSKHGPSLSLSDALSLLGRTLGNRAIRTQRQADLDRAVEVGEQAVLMMEPDHPSYAITLYDLDTWRRLRLRPAGEQQTTDLPRGQVPFEVDIQHHDLSAAQVSPTNAMLSQYVSDLRYLSGTETTIPIEELGRAADNAARLAKELSQRQSGYAGIYMSAGRFAFLRLRRTLSEDDAMRAASFFMAALRCTTESPAVRIQAARMAAMVCMMVSSWTSANSTSQEALLLLPKLSLRSLSQIEIQDTLSSLYGLPSMAAVASLRARNEPAAALQSLELCCGVATGLLMDMRVDLTDLKAAFPEMGTRFEALRDELDSQKHSLQDVLGSFTSMSSLEENATRRRKLDRELDDIVQEIRDLPGFRGFLQPPTTEEMMAAAARGPIVVVNAPTHGGSHAFLVEANNIRTVELPDLSLADIAKRAADLGVRPRMGPLLEWLWSVLCGPCLEALSITSPPSDGEDWPHVHWIPTGHLRDFPLHAAGQHRPGSTDTVLDRVISSYSSSIKALIHGQKRSAPKSDGASAARTSALMVGMRTTKGWPTLGFVPEEVRILKDLCPGLGMVPIEPPRLKDEVLRHLPACSIFHFAGHGESDPKSPLQSSLFLEDWEKDRVTVGNIRDIRSPDGGGPFLAYLSACSTGANKVGDLDDEGIHLISAFQIAGFRHVIGTLWEVDDKRCVDVAKTVYETLQQEAMTDGAVARGLHKAIKILRDREFYNASDANAQVDAVAGEHTDGDADRKAVGFQGKRIHKGKVMEQDTADRHRTMGHHFWIPYVHYGP